jgi:outer membrane protein
MIRAMQLKPMIIGLAWLVGAIPLAAAFAAEDCGASSDECVAVGHWNFQLALGAGVRTNPLLGGENIPLVVIPHVSYYGKRFFLDDLDVGVTLADSGSNTFNLVASPGYDRVYFYRSDLQNIFVIGFPTDGTAIPAYRAVDATTPGAMQFSTRSRRVTYLAGPEWTFKFAELTGQFDFRHEITGRNHGNEIRAAIAVPLIQAHGVLTGNLGITWNSAAIVNYYYGENAIYQGGSALNPFAKLGYALPLNDRWRLNAFVQFERLGDAIANSPIVAEHHVATSFVGVTYTF